MPVEWVATSKTRAQSAKLAPSDRPQIGTNLGVACALRSAVLALCMQNLPSGRTLYPHVKISSKFEVLGPRNGRGGQQKTTRPPDRRAPPPYLEWARTDNIHHSHSRVRREVKCTYVGLYSCWRLYKLPGARQRRREEASCPERGNDGERRRGHDKGTEDTREGESVGPPKGWGHLAHTRAERRPVA